MTPIFSNPQAGDPVVLQRAGKRDEIRAIKSVSRWSIFIETMSRVPWAFDFDGTNYGGSENISPATPADIARINAEVAERGRLAKLEADRISNDPRTPLISRFNGGWEKWDKLTLEQLQTIAGWLDNN